MAIMERFFLPFLLLLSLSCSMQAYYVRSGSCSVDVVNDMRTSIAEKCRSGYDDLGNVIVRSLSGYHVEFDPNFFGTTLFLYVCEWDTRRQDIEVWQGDANSDQLKCADEGPCVWKVTTRGFYWSNQTYGDASSWTFYTDSSSYHSLICFK